MSGDRNVPASQRLLAPASRAAVGAVLLAATGLFALATPTLAQHFSSEKDVAGIRLGQRVKVDDGTCPAGQVKEISGTKMTAEGVARTRKCVPSVGTKHK